MPSSFVVFDDFIDTRRVRTYAEALVAGAGGLSWLDDEGVARSGAVADLPRCGVDEADAFLRDLGASEDDLRAADFRRKITRAILTEMGDAADAIDARIALIAATLVAAPDVVHGAPHRREVCPACVDRAARGVARSSRDNRVARMASILVAPPVGLSAEELLGRVAHACHRGRADRDGVCALLDFVEGRDLAAREPTEDRIAELALTIYLWDELVESIKRPMPMDDLDEICESGGDAP